MKHSSNLHLGARSPPCINCDIRAATKHSKLFRNFGQAEWLYANRINSIRKVSLRYVQYRIFVEK